MTNEEINYILSIEHYLNDYRKSMVMAMPIQDQIKLKEIYHKVMGTHIPNCSTCFIEHFTSIVIKANAEKQLIVPTIDELTKKALELASIADDEQKEIIINEHISAKKKRKA